MIVSQASLLTLVQNSVVELRFARRRQKYGWSPYRRALVCNNRQLLNSVPGQLALHFRPPMHPPAYPWMYKNLVCSWDIFWQDWRMIPAESTDVVKVFPVQTEEDSLKWWQYFNEFLQDMTPAEKMSFMNK